MQQAARASDTTVFMTMGDDRAGYVVETGRDGRDLHQPEEPADRGLRVRSVRLSEDDADDRPDSHSRAAHRTRRSTLAPGIGRVSQAPTGHPAPRATLDREEQLIKDAVLRMGVLVEAPDPRGQSTPSSTHDAARAAAASSRATRSSTRPSASVIDAHRGDDRDPAAGRPRPALPAHARPRHLRARADRRPRRRRVAKQALKLAAGAAAQGYVHLPEMAELRRRARPRHPPGARRRRRRSGPRGRGRRRRDRPPLPRDLRRGRRAHAARTRPTSSAARGSSSRRTTSSGSATG